MDTTMHSVTAQMSLYDLAQWRIEDLLYVRPIHSENEDAFAVFAADGTYLDQVDTLEEVYDSARTYDMEVAALN